MTQVTSMTKDLRIEKHYQWPPRTTHT